MDGRATLAQDARFFDTGQETDDVFVPVEQPLDILVDGRLAAVLMRLPGQEKELALGFCLTEGWIESLDDVLLLHHCGSADPSQPEQPGDMVNRVLIRTSRAEQRQPDSQPRLITSGCGQAPLRNLLDVLVPVPDGEPLNRSVVLACRTALLSEQTHYATTRGTHAAGIFDRSGALLAMGEDIGRHNAVDKAIGRALLLGLSLRQTALIVTGRVSFEMVQKAVRAQIPIVASLSASTSLGVEIAQKMNVTLVASLRGNRGRILTHPERLA